MEHVVESLDPLPKNLGRWEKTIVVFAIEKPSRGSASLIGSIGNSALVEIVEEQASGHEHQHDYHSPMDSVSFL